MGVKKVLIVDDDAVLCELLQNVLESAGYDVTCAGNCEEARHAMEQLGPRVVLLDLVLPDGKGTDLLEELKTGDPDLLCIILTAHADLDSAMAALEGGAFHYVRKPIASKELLSLMDRLFEIHRLREEKLRYERELRARSEQTEERYRMLAENVSDVLWVMELDMSFSHVSPSVTQMMGYSVEEILDLSLVEMVHPEDFDRIKRVLSEELNRDSDDPREDRSRTVVMRQKCKDGKYIWAEAIARFLRDPDGKPVRILGVTRDITERKQAMEKLSRAKEAAEDASRLKSEFLGNLGHELRTPLAGMIGIASLLAGTELGPKQREYVDTVLRSAEALLVVINDLLDLSKIETGRLVIEEKRFEPRKTVDEVIGLLEARAVQKGIELKAQINPGVPSEAVGDAARLRQVLANLVGNAIKFTERGRVEVEVKGVAKGEDLVETQFVVRDTGIGIDEKEQEIIFDKFTQVDGSASRRYQGTGLGLAISRQLVDLMGGDIGVESRSGAGSTFWFKVPFVSPDDPATREGHTKEERRSTDAHEKLSLKVLVVEDNEVSQEVAATILKKLGCDVELATHGHQAVEMAGENSYDAIFMDCQMPKMDGFEATREIRRKEAGADERVFIVAMTAHSLEEDRRRCEDAGMDDYIAKPATVGDFQQVLKRLVDREADQENE